MQCSPLLCCFWTNVGYFLCGKCRFTDIKELMTKYHSTKGLAYWYDCTTRSVAPVFQSHYTTSFPFYAILIVQLKEITPTISWMKAYLTGVIFLRFLRPGFNSHVCKYFSLLSNPWKFFFILWQRCITKTGPKLESVWAICKFVAKIHKSSWIMYIYDGFHKRHCKFIMD